jgi:capsular polysaccharide biosynthesis protein
MSKITCQETSQERTSVMPNQNNQLPVDIVNGDITKDINLYHLLKYYLKHWMWIVALTVIGLIAGVIYSFYIQTPLYKSEATLAVVLPSTASSTDTTLGNYVQLFQSRRVLDPVISKLKINESYDQFASTFDVSNDTNTDIILVSATSPNREQSTAIMSSAITSFNKEVNNIYNADNVRIVDNANEPSKPYNVNLLIQLAIASAAGFIVSIIGLFFAYDFKQNEQNSISVLVNNTEAIAAQREKKNELRRKQIDNEKHKKDIEKNRLEKAELKRLDREAKQAKRIADKKAIARRKNIAKKARIEQTTIQKNLNKIELTKKAKTNQERKIEKSKAHLLLIAERKEVRKIMRTNISLGIKSALFPLKKKIEESKAIQSLKYEARQAERIAQHEERMAKIEDMRASSLEKRIAAISKSTKLVERLEKEKKIVTIKKESTSQPAVAQSNGNIFYARIKANILDRRGKPYELPGMTTKTKNNLLDRIRRNRSK